MIQEQRSHLIKSLTKGIRYDGRKLDQFREIVVEYGVTNSAEGSARVKIGDTEVIAGVKMEVSDPFPDTPEDGALMVGAEFLPMASPEFELGPPGIIAIEIARVADRGIRESGAVDLKKLCIKKGELVWMVVLDICTINDAGNIMDATSLAAIAALKNTVFPKLNGEKIDYDEKTKEKLPLKCLPIGVTVLKVGDLFIVDPSTEEEKLYDARLTVTSVEDGSMSAMQKGGETPISAEDIDRMVELAVTKAKEIRKSL